MPMTERDADHERIWLEPPCEGSKFNEEGRTWCKDQVWGACPDCGTEPTEYIRADLALSTPPQAPGVVDGFAQGIEAAAKWHEAEAERIRLLALDTDEPRRMHEAQDDHLSHAAFIRTLVSTPPVSGEVGELVVAWRWRVKGGEVWRCSTDPIAADRSFEVEPLVPLSALTAANADRDRWKAACMEAREGCNQRSRRISSLIVKEDRLRAVEGELSAISGAIGSVRFMDPPDGGSVTLAEQVRRMREELEAAEADRDRLARELERNKTNSLVLLGASGEAREAAEAERARLARELEEAREALTELTAAVETIGFDPAAPRNTRALAQSYLTNAQETLAALASGEAP